MRFALILAFLPLPAAAWQFSPDPICTLSHQTDTADIMITYDASLPEYKLIITMTDIVWEQAGSFRMAFRGGREVTIGTTQHERSADGRSLIVRDSGFGNVLDGLEFNTTVTSQSGASSVSADLSDAAPAVRAFRACPSDSPPLS